jgi:hypothetical protein
MGLKENHPGVSVYGNQGGNTLQNSTLDQNFPSNSSNTQPGLEAPVTGQQPT